LGHRRRGESMPVVAAVMVALQENRVAARDEQAGGEVAPEVIVDGRALALVLVTHRRLHRRALEPRRCRPSSHRARLADLIEVADRALEEGERVERPTIAHGIAVVRAEGVGVRPARREARPGSRDGAVAWARWGR